MKQLPFHLDLCGKTAVVTGGGGVLCAHFAHVLAACGAAVAILDLKEAAAARVAEAIIQSGGRARAYGVNVLDRTALSAVRESINKDMGPCDILINGAGGNHPRGTTSGDVLKPEELGRSDLTSFFDLDPEGINFVFQLNFTGTLLPTQVFARDMVGRDGSVVINISSMNADRPLTKIPAYSAAKAAVSNFTRWLAVHFAPAGIRVNAISPGFFVTEQNRSLLFDGEGHPTPRATKILGHTPQGRFGRPDDLTGALLFLVSGAAAGFVTGIVLPIDGGFSAYSGV